MIELYGWISLIHRDGCRISCIQRVDGWRTDGWHMPGCWWCIVTQGHLCACVCLCLVVCGRMLLWRATHTGFVVCWLMAEVGIYTLPTPSPTTITSVCDSTHHTHPIGMYPPIWYKAGTTRMRGPGAGIGLCCCRWPPWLWPGGVYDVQDWELVPHSAPWEPRVHIRTRPEDPATHRATPAMLGRGGDCGRP